MSPGRKPNFSPASTAGLDNITLSIFFSIKRVTAPLNIPIVVDDTVATNVNVDVFKYADVATTSLTKYYSGVGDVIAGAVIVNQDSLHKDKIVSQIELHIPTYTEKNLPKDLSTIKAIKPGSRNL